MNYLRPVEVPPSHPDHSGLVDGLKDFKGANYIVVGESPLEFRVHGSWQGTEGPANFY
jgi:hypothetical protein